MRSSPRPGFTLIELLVVVAIIGVLSALTLGIVGLVREQARSIDCLSKVRQLGMATEAYGTDNEGFLYQAQVAYAPGVTNTDIDPVWGMWPGRIMPYLVTRFRGSTATLDPESWNRYFNCPSGNWTVGEIKALADQGIGHGLSCVWTTSYGMNSGWRGLGLRFTTSTAVVAGTSYAYEHYRLAAMRLPSATILLGEKWGVADGSSPPLPDDRAGVNPPNPATPGWAPVATGWPRKTAAPSPDCSSASIRRSHRGRMVLLFADLHAGRHRLEETWNGVNYAATGWWSGIP